MKTWLPKLSLFAVCLVPAVYIGWQAWLSTTGQPNVLGPDPGKAIEHFNGDWALRFLLITLAVTPLRQVSGWTGVVRYRRMMGLFTFFYVCLHVASYVVFMMQFSWHHILADIGKKPYILVGFAAFCCLVPMAATSNQWMMRRLKRRWKSLHRLIYLVAVLALIHLFWLTRSSYYRIFVYAAIAAVLLGYRIWRSPSAQRWLGGIGVGRRGRGVNAAAR